MTELSSVIRNCAEARVRRTIPPGELFPSHRRSRPQSGAGKPPARWTNSLPSDLCVGMRGFEPRTSCSQSRQALPSCATSRAKKRIIHSLFCYPLGSAVFITLLQQITLSWQADQRSQDRGSRTQAGELPRHESTQRGRSCHARVLIRARLLYGSNESPKTIATVMRRTSSPCSCASPSRGTRSPKIGREHVESIERLVRTKSPETADNWCRSLTEPVHLPRRLRRDHEVANREDEAASGARGTRRRC